MSGASPTTALLLSTIAGACTLVGWAIAASRATWSTRWFAGALWLAATAMIAVSAIELIPAAHRAGLSLPMVALCCAIGALAVWALTWVAGRFTALAGKHRAGVLIALAVGLHNIPEGAAPFASSVVAIGGGIVITIAIALHNIPEGLAIAAPVMAHGGTRTRAFWLTFAAGAAEVVGALLALAFLDYLTPTRMGALEAFVAGIMLMIAAVELIPAAVKATRGGGLESIDESVGLAPVSGERRD